MPPFFHGLENTISAVVFGVPAVVSHRIWQRMEVANFIWFRNNDAYEMRICSVKINHQSCGRYSGGISTGFYLV